MPVLLPELESPTSLVGTWRGEGVVDDPTTRTDEPFGQEITLGFYGKPLLAYLSRTWALYDSSPDGAVGQPMQAHFSARLERA